MQIEGGSSRSPTRPSFGVHPIFRCGCYTAGASYERLRGDLRHLLWYQTVLQTFRSLPPANWAHVLSLIHSSNSNTVCGSTHYVRFAHLIYQPGRWQIFMWCRRLFNLAISSGTIKFPGRRKLKLYRYSQQKNRSMYCVRHE